MLALLYLVVMVTAGDAISRRIYRSNWLPFRFASAFLVGLILSSWTTYLSARIFAQTSKPLLFGNLLFLALAAGLLYWLRIRFPIKDDPESSAESAPVNKADVITIGIFLVCAWWMMFSSFNMDAGKLQIANHQWSDFGPNVAIMQSFAYGHNFPTEYPHFSGDRIRYHFLFYFQAGNLEYLGLNPAWSNNLLSVLSLVSMLVLVIALGELLFKSRAVGRIGAALFFFHGSLNYFSFIRQQGSIGKAFTEAVQLKGFLPSGFPFRGEDWGVWSLVNFINQRHFASAIGILLLVIIFLVTRYRSASAPAEESWKEVLTKSGPYVFNGVLLGLLPMWNGAVFIAAAAVLGVLFLLFPVKRQMLVLGAAAAIVALPQIIYLKTGNVHAAGYSLFHWGYTIEHPTPLNTLKYLAWTFGFKWLAVGVALVVATALQRRLLLAISSLLAIAFLFQFSEEVLANHKFLNVWLIVLNLFVAFGLWQLWTRQIKGNKYAGKVLAVAVLVLITAGGVIDLFPIHNSYFVEIPYDGDRLVRWAREETKPRSVFLTDRFVTHRLLLAGRQIFHGWPYYTWGAGYLATERDDVYKQLFEETDANKLLTLLRQNNIDYVAIDAGVRNGTFIKNLNEGVYERNFQKVFTDTDNQYDGLSIFKVPANGEPFVAVASPEPASSPAATSGNALRGGTGNGPAQFNKPRGMTVDPAGNIYVADAGNSRIQKFSSHGEFLTSFGKAGAGEGELREPNGVVVDSDGNIYVTDSANNRVIKLKSDGSFIKQWSGPEPGFYGPRDIAIGRDRLLYVLDQGRARIVKMNAEGETLGQWGKVGSGEGEFNSPTGLTVAGERVYVADAGNNRIQVFGLDGKFITHWNVPRWEEYLWHFPDVAVDDQAGRIYVSSGWTREVLVLDMKGNYLESIKPGPPQEFNNASAVVVFAEKKEKRLYVLNTGTYVVNAGPPSVSSFELRMEKTK